MVRQRNGYLVLVAATAMMGMALTACGRDESSGGTQSTPGISDSTVKIGISVPLSGPVSDAGTAQLGGAKAYYEAINAAGGVRMRDGKTRKIELTSYDDGYEPGRSAQNFRRLVQQDGALAVVGGLGTAQNAAVLPVAKELGVPQVFVASGASLFSAKPADNPWTIGWQPTYEAEGEALAQAAIALNRPVTVAVLRQNDDLGKAFLNGFNKGIEGSQVKLAGTIQTYEAADTTVDSQITNLAATKAEVLLSAVAVVRLQISALTKARELNWKPVVLLPGFTQGFSTVLKPSGADAYFDQIYSTGFVKIPSDPQWSSDQAVTEFTGRMKQYSPQANANLPNAVWGYATAATFVRALETMDGLTRQNLMDAIRKLKADDIPMLLPGVTVDASAAGKSPVNVTKLFKFADGKYSLAQPS
ncbi:MAG TPA: ABC transporter substrate-binding protein [Micromonosporaceae bacterium]|nr:ABC transporter substrate-binding protein [Micromonosporaceae bacterium]